MRRRAIFGALVFAVAATLALTLLPSGGSQHYTAILGNTAKAAGTLTPTGTGGGGGGGSADAISTGRISFIDGFGVDVSSNPPGVLLGQFAWACAEMHTPAGDDQGCKFYHMPPAGNVFAPGVATVHFRVPSSLHPGGWIKVVVTLVGDGVPTIVPTLDLLHEIPEHDFIVGPALSFSQPAKAAGTLASTTLGVHLFNGHGTIGLGIGTAISSCQGPCIEPTPTPTPTPTSSD
jgi:hypothetical protein